MTAQTMRPAALADVADAGPALATGAWSGVDAVWQTINGMANSFLAMLPLLIAGIAVFLLLLLTASFIRKLAERALARAAAPNAATAIGRLLHVGMTALAALIAVTVAFPSMTPGRLISVLGIGSIAVGFAFKDIFQNLLAGILILLRHPFRIGDEITTGDFTGTVEAIEARATFIRTYDGRRVIIPNSDVYTKPVTVISAYDLLRSDYDVGIGYGDDFSNAKVVALRAVQGVEGVLDDPSPDVLVWELAGSSKNLRVRWWTRPQRAQVLEVRDRVIQAVAEALSSAGIDLPFPTQVLLLHDQTEAADGDRTRQREGWPAGKSPPPRRLGGAAEERYAANDERRRNGH